jgi:5'-nucleotidase
VLARADHDVAVVAPVGDCSGAGTSLSLAADQPVSILRRFRDEPSGIPFIGIDGTPALAVLLARMGAFGPPPWCVLSGINAGTNTGRSILHSGTVGAALTAATLGMSGLAVSLHAAEGGRLDTAAEIAGLATTWLASARKRTVLNINVPDLPIAALRGVRWGRLAALGRERMTIDRVEEHQIHFRIAESGLMDPQTDAGLIEDGYVVATPLTGPQAVADPAAAQAIGEALARHVSQLTGHDQPRGG